MYKTSTSASSLDAPEVAMVVRDAAVVAPETEDLSGVLQRYFGFGTFRPLQEEIVQDTLQGRDVLALMPTGGGKSLCYQLPALVRPGLTVVVSPLIALMKDQFDALRRHGISVAMINSHMHPDHIQDVIAGLSRGDFRLLYVAPERLMQPAFLAQLGAWNVAMFAIDEAHCISDWGHDFRPEYRQLAELRMRFPDVPMMALTATATDRVRRDIVTQLGLRDPGIYVASFNRPNLTYTIDPKKKPYARVMEFLKGHKGKSGIIYCHSRKSTERLAARLTADGIRALPYHAGMEPVDRTRNQERFLSDDVRIVCATVAFGMGVNKPNIRFVVHYDLPKNIESYYQETGRAGRDGDPADCLMLFGKSDLFMQERFIDEKPTAREQDIAREQLDALVEFAESRDCRRQHLLAYFSEEYPEPSCGSCDNCKRETRGSHTSQRDVSAPERASAGTEDRTQDARRFLACLNEIVRTSGFSVGAGTVADVLMGSGAARIARFTGLKWYASGKHVSKEEWSRVSEALVEGGFVQRPRVGLPVLEITESGRRLLAGEPGIAVNVAIPAPRTDGVAPYDAKLFERLRGLRKQIAQQREVAAFMIFSDAALRQMSREYPVTAEEFRRINGVGEAKLADLGPQFIEEIDDYVRTHGRKTFEGEASPDAERRYLGDSENDTLRLFREGRTVAQIAEERSLKESTILGHLVAAVEAGEAIDITQFLAADDIPEIQAAFDTLGWANLTGVRELLGERYEYAVLRMYRALKLRDAPELQALIT